MSVEILGMITATPSSEVDQPLGEAVDAGFVRRFAQAHEDAGFDRVLVGYFSNAAEGAVVSSFVAAATRRLGVLLAYRPGVIAAPLAARQLATLDQFSEGRLALNVVNGGNDEDLARDGDYLDHDRRYARTDEYLQALRAIWTATGPVDFDGEFYRFQGASPAVRPRQSPHIPIYFSGSSDAAIEVAARHADTYMLWGEPLAAVDGHIRRVRAAAKAQGRDPSGRSSRIPRRPPGSVPPRCSNRSARTVRASVCRCATTSRRMSVRSACWPPPSRARCSTAVCGPAWPG
ncbi:Alkanesulfonate monooxygenase [Pseudomonas aeruginosa]|nr:Alkanesulfonate monooxygenase [Pseudomonas aeruginosa]